MDSYEDLIDNVRDWFCTHCRQCDYDCIDDFIDDIRCAIAYSNESMCVSCMDDLVNTYEMSSDYVESFHNSIVDVLAEEAQFALDNFEYPDCDDDE